MMHQGLQQQQSHQQQHEEQQRQLQLLLQQKEAEAQCQLDEAQHQMEARERLYQQQMEQALHGQLTDLENRVGGASAMLLNVIQTLSLEDIRRLSHAAVVTLLSTGVQAAIQQQEARNQPPPTANQPPQQSRYVAPPLLLRMWKLDLQMAHLCHLHLMQIQCLALMQVQGSEFNSTEIVSLLSVRHQWLEVEGKNFRRKMQIIRRLIGM